MDMAVLLDDVDRILDKISRGGMDSLTDEEWGYAWLLTPRESYAAEAIAHVRHEQGSLVRTSATVDAASLEIGFDLVAERR